MPRLLWPLTTRGVFRSDHVTLTAMTGRECTIVEVYDQGMYDYRIRFDDTKEISAADKEFTPLDPTTTRTEGAPDGTADHAG